MSLTKKRIVFFAVLLVLAAPIDLIDCIWSNCWLQYFRNPHCNWSYTCYVDCVWENCWIAPWGHAENLSRPVIVGCDTTSAQLDLTCGPR